MKKTKIKELEHHIDAAQSSLKSGLVDGAKVHLRDAKKLFAEEPVEAPPMNIQETLCELSIQLRDIGELLKHERDIFILMHRIIKKIQEKIEKGGD